MLEIFQRENLRVLRVYGASRNRCNCKAVPCLAPGKHPAPWHKEKINKGVYNARYATELTDADFEGFNIGVACGNGVVVIDIDPRNGGHLTWMELSAGKDTGDTLEVSTGGGGRHIYYRANGIKSISFGGIDVQSEGKYVVAPPSRHFSGKTYDWTEGETIAPMPKWLLDHILDLSGKVSASLAEVAAAQCNYVPAEHEWPWIHEILAQLSPRIGYTNWLGVGMGLHSTGHSQAFKMWDEWSRKDPQQYVPGECAKKWASFRMRHELDKGHTYRWIFAMADMYNIKYGTGAAYDFNKPITKVPIDTALSEEFEKDHGVILNSLAKSVNDFVFTKDKKLSLAIALQVLSAAAQGTFVSPTMQSLNLYQWIATIAGFGKGRYEEAVRLLLDMVHPNLKAPKVGTSGGIRMALQAFNSLVFIKDEWHDDYLNISQSKNEYSRMLLQDYKMLYNGSAYLDRILIKSEKQVDIKLPTVSILGFSTLEGLSKCAGDGSFINSGLASRFIYWLVPIKESGSNFVHDMPLTMDPEVRAHLQDMFMQGAAGVNIRPASAVEDEMYEGKKPIGKKKKEVVERKPDQAIMKRDIRLGYTKEAMDAFSEYTKVCDGEISDRDPNLDDLVSLIQRKIGTVNRLMSLRALSDYRREVVLGDVEWAIELTNMNTKAVVEHFHFADGATAYDVNTMRNAGKIFRMLDKAQGGLPITNIFNNTGLSARNSQDAINHLIRCGLVGVIDRQGNLCYPEKIPQQCKLVAVPRP